MRLGPFLCQNDRAIRYTAQSETTKTGLIVLFLIHFEENAAQLNECRPLIRREGYVQSRLQRIHAALYCDWVHNLKDSRLGDPSISTLEILIAFRNSRTHRLNTLVQIWTTRDCPSCIHNRSRPSRTRHTAPPLLLRKSIPPRCLSMLRYSQSHSMSCHVAHAPRSTIAAKRRRRQRKNGRRRLNWK